MMQLWTEQPVPALSRPALCKHGRVSEAETEVIEGDLRESIMLKALTKA